MNVTDAVAKRSSIRAFLDTPVEDTLLSELLTKAARAPSGGNLQPWRVAVLNGEVMSRFQEHLATTQVQDAPDFIQSNYETSCHHWWCCW